MEQRAWSMEERHKAQGLGRKALGWRQGPDDAGRWRNGDAAIKDKGREDFRITKGGNEIFEHLRL